MAESDIDLIEDVLNNRVELSGEPAIQAAVDRLRERLKDPCVHESAIVQGALNSQQDAEEEMIWLRQQLDAVSVYLDAEAHVERDEQTNRFGDGVPYEVRDEAWAALDWEHKPRCTYSEADATGPCRRLTRDGSDRCRTHRRMEEALARVPETSEP